MYRIKIIDEDDGRVLTDAKADCAALVYGEENGIGIYAHTFMNCDNEMAFHIALSLDKIRDHILDRNFVLQLMYALKDEIIEGTTEIDVGAINRALEHMGEDDG